MTLKVPGGVADMITAPMCLRVVLLSIVVVAGLLFETICPSQVEPSLILLPSRGTLQGWSAAMGGLSVGAAAVGVQCLDEVPPAPDSWPSNTTRELSVCAVGPHFNFETPIVENLHLTFSIYKDSGTNRVYVDVNFLSGAVRNSVFVFKNLLLASGRSYVMLSISVPLHNVTFDFRGLTGATHYGMHVYQCGLFRVF